MSLLKKIFKNDTRQDNIPKTPERKYKVGDEILGNSGNIVIVTRVEKINTNFRSQEYVFYIHESNYSGDDVEFGPSHWNIVKDGVIKLAALDDDNLQLEDGVLASGYETNWKFSTTVFDDCNELFLQYTLTNHSKAKIEIN